jgi:hypothetical protein
MLQDTIFHPHVPKNRLLLQYLQSPPQQQPQMLLHYMFVRQQQQLHIERFYSVANAGSSNDWCTFNERKISRAFSGSWANRI